MEQIPAKDREILRSLAKRRLEYANCPKNEEILKNILYTSLKTKQDHILGTAIT